MHSLAAATLRDKYFPGACDSLSSYTQLKAAAIKDYLGGQSDSARVALLGSLQVCLHAAQHDVARF